jgi:diguanylate cyclase (GGDEF)-like protein
LRPYITPKSTYLAVLSLWLVLLLWLSVQWVRLQRTLARQMQANLAAMHTAVDEYEAKTPAFCAIPQQDELTGIYNRSGFIEYWRQACRVWADNDQVALLMVNLDHFAELAENWGADMQARALVAVANSLKSRIRPQDKLARWQEGQFILLSPHTQQAEALLLAEKLRQHIHLITLDDTQPVVLTVSIGVVLFRTREPLEGAYTRCQNRLNEERVLGNRVVDCGGAAA